VVVLGAPLQHLNGAADFVVAADHRIELALLGPLGQVDGVSFQRLSLILRAGVLDLLAAAHGLDAALDQAPGRTYLAQQGAQFALVLQRGQHEQFGGDIGILALLGQFVGQVQQPRQSVGNLHVTAGPFDARQAVQRASR